MPGQAITIDARGLRCPLPVLRLARAMRQNPAVTQFRLLSDDPGTAGELAAWSVTANAKVSAAEGSFEVARA